MEIKSFRDLEVWRIGMQVVGSTYRITRAFPAEEKFGLVSQMQRAAVSIPSNIAEGHARAHLKEYIRHVNIAQGSLAELVTQLELSSQLGFTQSSDATEIGILLDVLGRKLRALRDSLSKHLQ